MPESTFWMTFARTESVCDRDMTSKDLLYYNCCLMTAANTEHSLIYFQMLHAKYFDRTNRLCVILWNGSLPEEFLASLLSNLKCDTAKNGNHVSDVSKHTMTVHIK